MWLVKYLLVFLRTSFLEIQNTQKIHQNRVGRKMSQEEEMTNLTFNQIWLPQMLQDFQKLPDIQKEETLRSLLSIMGPREKWLLQTTLPDLLFRDFITTLPIEILEQILNYLSFEDLMNCCLVSKRWNEYLSSLPVIWRNQAWKQGMNTQRQLFDGNAWKNYAFYGK